LIKISKFLTTCQIHCVHLAGWWTGKWDERFTACW